MGNPSPSSPEIARFKLEQSVKGGANWFYWIAALSAANSLAIWFNARWSFFLGLGLTQLLDAVGLRFGTLGAIVAICFDLAAVLVFCLIGYLAHRRGGAFVVGMVLYALDAVLLLALGAFLAAGFHVFALVFLFKGWQAVGQLRAMSGSTPVPVEAAPELAPSGLTRPEPEEEPYFDDV